MGPSHATTMKTPAHQKLLCAALNQQIRYLNRSLKLISKVDLEVYSLGRDIFSDDLALIQWLSEPAPSLRGAIPLQKLRSADGRTEVVHALTRIAHGIPT